MEESWLDGWREQIARLKNSLMVPSKSWTHGWLKPDQLPDGFQGRDLDPGKDYVEIRLRSMRIPFERKLSRRYYGAVHSFISLDSLSGSGEAVFSVVTTPSSLQNVDPENVSNVIQYDVPLLGPVPYQGGSIRVEAGVFSVLEQDLIVPFLKVIEDISRTAGVSIVSQAMPFVQPIQSAIYSLIGASPSNKLEIGIKMQVDHEGYLVALGDSSSGATLSKLRLEGDGRLFNGKDEIIKHPYMVLTVKASKNREGIARVPDVLKAMQELVTAIRNARTKASILESYDNFARVTRSCLDLLPADAELIVKNTYEERVKSALERVQETPKGEQPSLEIDRRKEKKLLNKDLSEAKTVLKKIDAVMASRK